MLLQCFRRELPSASRTSQPCMVAFKLLPLYRDNIDRDILKKCKCTREYGLKGSKSRKIDSNERRTRKKEVVRDLQRKRLSKYVTNFFKQTSDKNERHSTVLSDGLNPH